jgi:hypothetical protein
MRSRSVDEAFLPEDFTAIILIRWLVHIRQVSEQISPQCSRSRGMISPNLSIQSEPPMCAALGALFTQVRHEREERHTLSGTLQQLAQ